MERSAVGHVLEALAWWNVLRPLPCDLKNPKFALIKKQLNYTQTLLFQFFCVSFVSLCQMWSLWFPLKTYISLEKMAHYTTVTL